jgi:hypothetical protein
MLGLSMDLQAGTGSGGIGSSLSPSISPERQEGLLRVDAVAEHMALAVASYKCACTLLVVVWTRTFACWRVLYCRIACSALHTTYT